MQLFHRYFTFLVGVRTQKAFIFCQQQYVAVFGRLNLDNLNVLGIFFHIVVDGMKAANKDGKLTKDEIAQLGNLLYEKTTAKLSASAMDVLTAAQVDISALITGTAEQLISGMK